tara:strand:+ start:26 stop:850 length:825 start_codon:yes stop_codon:yes gene_type:complete
MTKYIIRIKNGDNFTYKNSKKEDIERIKKLRIPPMWNNVKIDPNPNSKIQATGYDSKNRKQYIYNKDFVEKKKNLKFKKINSFDYKKYNKVINYYINKKDLSKNCVIANIIKLMEDLNIRVGNETYKKENGSYGITTLQKKHLKGDVLIFIGKKGIEHKKNITNKNSLEFIKKILSIKGPDLFYDSSGNKINSKDLNDFLKTKIQENITCKDIRTYSANKIFLDYMKKNKKGITENERKKNVLEGIDYTSKELGNSRKICRDSYLNPENINKFL